MISPKLMNFQMNLATYDPNANVQVVKNIVGLICIKDIFEDIMQEELIDQDYHFDSTAPNHLIVNKHKHFNLGNSHGKIKSSFEMKDCNETKKEHLLA